MQALGSVLSVVSTPVKLVSQVTENRDTLRKTVQIAGYILLAANPVTPTIPMEKLSLFVTFIDFTDIVGIASYFTQKKADGSGKTDFQEDCRQKKVSKLIGMAFFTAGIVTGSALFLQELGVTAIGTAAAKIGTLPVFGLVAKGVATVGLTPVVLTTFATAFFFTALDDLEKMRSDESSTKDKVLSGFDFVSHMSDAALMVALFVPGVGVPVIVTLGIVAKGTGIVRFLMEKNISEKSFENDKLTVSAY